MIQPNSTSMAISMVFPCIHGSASLGLYVYTLILILKLTLQTVYYYAAQINVTTSTKCMQEYEPNNHQTGLYTVTSLYLRPKRNVLSLCAGLTMNHWIIV